MKPISDAYPPALRAWMIDNDHTAKSFSLAMGMTESWLAGLFLKGDSALSKYERVADVLKISLDDLVLIIKRKQMAEYLDLQISEKKFSSLWNIASRARVSGGFITSLYKNDGKLKTISSYVEIASFTRIELEKLRQRAISERITA